jgi:hypothetical protein
MSETGSAQESKVILIYPPTWFEEIIIPGLINSELQTVVLEEYKMLKRVINDTPSGIFVFHLEKGLEVKEWKRIINGFAEDFKNAKASILLVGRGSSEALLSGMNLSSVNLIAVDLTRSHTVVEQTIMALCKKLYRRGFRKFIRVNPTEQSKAEFNLPGDSTNMKGIIHDISSTGMAFSFAGEKAPRLPKGKKMDRVQLKLNSRLCLVNGIIMGQREVQGRTIFVLLFNRLEETGAVPKIKEFIQQELQLGFTIKFGLEKASVGKIHR